MAFLSRGNKLKIKETRKLETCRKGKHGRKRPGVEVKKRVKQKPENTGHKNNMKEKKWTKNRISDTVT